MANGNIEDLVRRSCFIISGTIERRAAATMAAVPVTNSTAVVRVNEVLQAPRAFADYAGREVTVQLSSARGASAGKQAVFFTNSWLYGEGLAVVEVGRVDPKGDLPAVRRQIAHAEQKIADDQLHGRLTRADLVIVGRVTATSPAPPQERRMPITEHDPDWWEAAIEIESVEKGQFDQKTITVLFANSTDEMWIDSPKYRPGQDGIWLLQRDQKEKGWPLISLPGYTALYPLDFQPRDQLDRVRALLKRR